MHKRNINLRNSPIKKSKFNPQNNNNNIQLIIKYIKGHKSDFVGLLSVEKTPTSLACP